MGLAAQVQKNIIAAPANCIEDIGSKNTTSNTVPILTKKNLQNAWQGVSPVQDVTHI